MCHVMLAIHLLMDVLVACVQLLAVVTKVAINNHTQIFVWAYVFISFGSYCVSGSSFPNHLLAAICVFVLKVYLIDSM